MSLKSVIKRETKNRMRVKERENRLEMNRAV